MEAAWIACTRGHRVTVFSASGEVGGKARLRARLPGGEAISSVYDYQHTEALRAGVQFKLGNTVTADTILGQRPDSVILATGASMIPPRWLPSHALDIVSDLRAAMQTLGQFTKRQQGTAVIYDMDFSEGVYACAEKLHALFGRVVIMTPNETIAGDTAIVTRQGIHRRLSVKGIEVLTLHEPCWSDDVEEGRLSAVQVYTGAVTVLHHVAFLAYATPRAPNLSLLAPLRAAGIELHWVGDCVSPRSVMAATAEGHDAGHAV
jgi:hypothetical protein